MILRAPRLAFASRPCEPATIAAARRASGVLGEARDERIERLSVAELDAARELREGDGMSGGKGSAAAARVRWAADDGLRTHQQVGSRNRAVAEPRYEG